MTSKELREAQFETLRKGGYDPASVDAMLERAADQIDVLTAEKQQNEQKMAVLAQKLEEYMAEEDKIRTTLLGAQKMSDTILREARQKAEIVSRDAAIKAERLVGAAAQKVEREEQSYIKIRAEVGKFKNDVLNIYKAHLEVLSTIPEPEPEPEPEIAEPEVEAVLEPQAEPENEAVTQPINEPEAAPIPEAETELEAEPQGEADSAAEPEPEEKPFNPFSADISEKDGEETRRHRKFSELDFGDDFSFNN